MISRRKFIEQGMFSAGAVVMKPLLTNARTITGTCDSKANISIVAEQDIYNYVAANNGAGPMWANGMTCVVRLGDQVLASGLETLSEVRGLSKCRWLLFKRYGSGWKLEAKDPVNLNREPCPLFVGNDQNVLLSVNPKQADTCVEYCLTHPEILSFNAEHPQLPYGRLVPEWKKNPGFMDHSYRAMAVDRMHKELILFQNYEYAHAEWSFMDRTGRWSVSDSLQWPTEVYNGKEVPLRLCYSNAAIRDRKVYFFSTADVVEPDEEWRAYKKQLTGATWDYVFRRLYFSWTGDITKEKFQPWIELANYDKTAGNIRNQDLWLDKEGKVHLLWIENAIDERLRNRFFPEEKQKRSLVYAVLKDGKKEIQTELMVYREGDKDRVFPSGNARFQSLPDGRLFVMYYVSGTKASGEKISENRLMEVFGNGTHSAPETLAFKKPFTSFQTANERAGCAPDNRLDIIGMQEGKDNVISYGQVMIR
ncbi:MAG: hypothetical protein M9933_06885 [Chitinophagaceae bacterium]|nr:hypothetical protein [Chitinophagaceae bacterium]